MRLAHRVCAVRRTTRRLALVLGLAFAGTASAELPVESLKVEGLAPLDPYRLYVSDPAMGHLVDGRTHVIDGNGLRYLGMVGTGFAGLTAVSHDLKTVFVATTYHSRLQRGTRTDVVEAYTAGDLTFQYEIEIPPKHVQGLAMRALMATSADDRFLLVQNATPATSVTVVDLTGRRFAAEIPTPGCYGVIPWVSQPRRFSAICGDGTLATFELDDQGALANRSVSEPFFDPDTDPVFMHYERVGDRLILVSYHGTVHTLDLGGAKPVAAAPWSLVDAADKQGWRPGGYQLFAIEPRSGRLFVGMHDKGAEGSHKSPAKEIWVFDLASRRRLARLPGQMAVAMRVAGTDAPRLFVLNGANNRVFGFDIGGDKLPTRPSTGSEPIGETPIFLGGLP